MVALFPGALLKNVPAEFTTIEGTEEHKITRIRPDWSWSFYNQAQYFVAECLDQADTRGNSDMAIEALQVVSDIFSKKKN